MDGIVPLQEHFQKGTVAVDPQVIPLHPSLDRRIWEAVAETHRTYSGSNN